MILLLLAVTLPPQALEAIGPCVEERTVETAYGTIGPLARRDPPEGAPVWVQPYSGLPSRTDPRATLQAARSLGIHQILAWDTAVAVNPVLGPGQSLLVTDYIDFTRHQPQTFFQSEGPGGISQTPAVCPRMTQALSMALPGAPGGVYLGVDGPRRETAAEARMFHRWGADVLGQNLVPEIALARELALCFAALVTVAATSAERPPQPSQGSVRRGLEAGVAALPGFLAALDGFEDCGCRVR